MFSVYFFMVHRKWLNNYTRMLSTVMPLEFPLLTAIIIMPVYKLCIREKKEKKKINESVLP